MGQRRKGTRVRGPYTDKSRGQWWFEIVEPSGAKHRTRLPRGTSKEEAEDAVAEVRIGLHAPDISTIKDGIDAYCAHLERIEDKTHTVDWHRRAVERLIGSTSGIDIWHLRPAHLERFIDATKTKAGSKTPDNPAGSPLAMATRRSYWFALERMCAWWAVRGLTARDVSKQTVSARERRSEPLPWRTPRGSRDLGGGRTQLRNEAEALRYLDTALAQPDADQRCGALLPLLCGLNSGETLHLRACDIDLESSSIWIGDDHGEWEVKRGSRAGSVPLPDDIRRDLIELAAKATGPDGYLFTQRNSDRPRSGTWLLKRIRAVCTDAKVRVSSPQGLRGTYSSLLRERERRSLANIASSLRHADSGRTASRSYVGAPERREGLRLVKRSGEKG